MKILKQIEVKIKKMVCEHEWKTSYFYDKKDRNGNKTEETYVLKIQKCKKCPKEIITHKKHK